MYPDDRHTDTGDQISKDEAHGRGSDTDSADRSGRPEPSQPPVPENVSHRMRSNRRRDTTPELALRRELHRRGLRYHVDRRVPGGPPNRIDLVFPRAKVAVEVYGCFWHQCPLHGTRPKTNDQAWVAKFAANHDRDIRVKQELETLGWSVEIVWEHEDTASAADRVQTRVRNRTNARSVRDPDGESGKPARGSSTASPTKVVAGREDQHSSTVAQADTASSNGTTRTAHIRDSAVTNFIESVPTRRTSTGSVFTRDWTVEAILDLVGYRPEHDLARLRVLEPSVGHGAFLVRVAERLLRSLRAHARPDHDLLGCVVAIDIDPTAVSICHGALRTLLSEEGVDPALAEQVANDWLRCEDFLDPGPDLAAFDACVGNPPYIRVEAIPPESLAIYRRRWKTMIGRADIYVGFLQACILALRPDGRLGVICTDRWMRNQYGAALRSLITQECGVEASLTLAAEGASFEDRVLAYPAIIVLRRGRQGPALVAHAADGLGPEEIRDLVALYHRGPRNDDGTERSPGKPVPEGDPTTNPKTSTTVDTDIETQVPGQLAASAAYSGVTASWATEWFHGTDSWPAGDPGALARLAELQQHLPTLKEAGVEIGVGIATGADAIFMPTELPDVEPHLLLPAVNGRDLSSGELLWRGRWLINVWDHDGNLIDLNTHPRLARHVRGHETVLRRRYIARKNPASWWRTIDKVHPGLAERPKLLLPDLKQGLHPVLDQGGHYPSHSIYYLTSDTWDLEVLGGLLLSKIANLPIDAYSTRMANGYRRVSSQYLRKIHLPALIDIGAEREELLRCAFRDRDSAASNSVFEEMLAEAIERQRASRDSKLHLGRVSWIFS